MKPVLFLLAATLLLGSPLHAEAPAGKAIVHEDFSKTDATATWRWGAGKWTVADGVLKGTETPERKHPAGIACQRDYHDAVIDFRFRFDGGNTAMLLLRNRFGNLCRLTLTPSSARLIKDKPNLPKDTPEKTVELDAAKLKLAPGEWHTVRATVRGGHFHAVIDGRTTLEGKHPGIDVAKTEIEFLAGGASILFDDLVAHPLDAALPAAEHAPAPGSLLPGGPSAWTLAWSEEFDGPDAKLEERWQSQNSASNHILSSRWRENAVVAKGTLKLLNKKEKRGGKDWTSGNIWTKEHFQYGYFECRYRYAAAEGTNNSFWIMTNTKPPAGKKSFEIDINEGHFPNEINTNIHNWSDIKVVNGKKTHPSSSKSFKPLGGKADFARDFHTYGLKWTEKELVFYFDGKELRREKNAFCHSPAPVWLSLAIIGWGGKITDAIDGTFMEVDYVRIYQAKQS